MAKMSESVAVIKISRLCRDDEVFPAHMDDELFTQIEAVLAELTKESGALVEFIRDK